MYNFTPILLEQIKSVVNDEHPLGPLDIGDVANPEVQQVLFESQNKIYEHIIKHPSIVVGRRGAGKTTFLKSLIHEKADNNIVIEIAGNHAFERIVETLQKSPAGVHVFAESVAELWDWVFWTSLLSKIHEDIPEECDVVNSSSWFQALRHSEGVQRVISILGKSKSESVSLLSQVLSSETDYSPENLMEVKETVIEALIKADVEAYVLLDSLENYQLDTERMGLAISGLLKASGRFNQIRRFPEIRVCLPAELYHQFREYSSNSVKDFRSQLLLHWHAGELLSLTAYRYRLFLNVYHEIKSEDLLNELNALDIHSRKGAIAFWKKILPVQIINSLGLEEDTLAYLLRHTHLLPRQMIYYLNAILRLNKRQGGDPFEVTEDAVVGGVTTAEREIWLEVCNAYQSVYPDAERVVKAVVSELPLVFDNSKLQKVYNRHGKRAVIHQGADFHDFKRMLIEIGCVGAVTGETDRYVIGVFEYTEGQELSVSSSTDLCLHPLFCGGEKTLNLKGVKKIVYPFGSDPEGMDRRDF